MKKFFVSLFSLILLFSCTNTMEKTDPDLGQNETIEDNHFVSALEAQEIATSFMKTIDEFHLLKSQEQPSLLGTDLSQMRAANESKQLPAYYLFGLPEKGFVIVSATKAAYPILGYSTESKVRSNNLPDGMKAVLSLYANQIKEARIKAVNPKEAILAMRKRIMRAASPAGNVVVDALLGEINWNQAPYYDAMCPTGAPVGCVATATSQIMRYWEYPDRAVGHHGYTSTVFGWQEHDYNYALEWSKMPKAPLAADNANIARFCYGVAVALDMNFDYSYNGGSGAQQTNVPTVLQRYYHYPKTVTNAFKDDYTAEEWEALVQGELRARRPVQYGGVGNGGGHSFVCDGFDDAHFFHINWGWGGEANGWFKLNALDPDSLGTGGGSGGFNRNQHIVIGFEPPKTVNGDNTAQVPGEEPNPEVEIVYPAVYTINYTDLYISFTRINDVKTLSSSAGYENLTRKSIPAIVAQPLKVEVMPEMPFQSEKAYLSIWLDANRNGMFEESEMLKKEPVTGLVSYSLSPATTLKRGQQYRLRIIVKKDSELKNPNEPFLAGEIEDYNLLIQ